MKKQYNVLHKAIFFGRTLTEAARNAHGDRNLLDAFERELVKIEFKRSRKAGYVAWTSKPVNEYECWFQRIRDERGNFIRSYVD